MLHFQGTIVLLRWYIEGILQIGEIRAKANADGTVVFDQMDCAY